MKRILALIGLGIVLLMVTTACGTKGKTDPQYEVIPNGDPPQQAEAPTAAKQASAAPADNGTSTTDEDLSRRVGHMAPGFDYINGCSCTCCPDKTPPPPPACNCQVEVPPPPPSNRIGNCDAIRGTDYRDKAEEDWFRANCNPPPAKSNPPAAKSNPPTVTQPYCPQTTDEIAKFAPGTHWENESGESDTCKWQTHGLKTRHTIVPSFTVKAGTQVDYSLGGTLAFHACEGDVVPQTPADGDLSLRFVFDPASCHKQFGGSATTQTQSPPPATSSCSGDPAIDFGGKWDPVADGGLHTDATITITNNGCWVIITNQHSSAPGLVTGSETTNGATVYKK